MTSVPCAACGALAPEFELRCPSCGSPLPEASAETRAGQLPETAADPLVGRVISHFRVLAPLGQGGMGVVYRAVDLELGREVALKLLAPYAAGGAVEEARFRREAQAAAALDHPNIGTLYEVGQDAGRSFLAMALYEGETLAARLARESRPLPVAEAVAIAAQLAAALAAAHVAGVVHRDLKPSNVLLTREGRVKLLDFGLAHLEDGREALTRHGLAVGTLDYMAPEQLRGEAVDARTDLWALGVVLYEMLAGRRPFGDGREAQPGRRHAILHEAPTPLVTLRPDLPPALAGVVDRCLEKDPERRWPGAAALFDELASAGLLSPALVSGHLVPLIPGAARRDGWRRRLAVWLAAAAALALVVFLGIRLAAPPPATLHVAVPRPVVAGEATEVERARVALNLQVAAIRALIALDGVVPVDPQVLRPLSGSSSEIARAVAAEELLTADSDCSGDLCLVTLRRLDSRDWRVLWTEALRLPLASPRLSAEAVTSAVRRAYPDRETRLALPELAVGEAEYRALLDLRRALEERTLPPETVLDRYADLRRRAPRFVELYAWESSLAASLFRSSGDRKYLDHGLGVARRARVLAPDDPRPLSSLFDLTLEAGRLDEAEAFLVALERADPGSAGVLGRRARLAERRGDGAGAQRLLAAAVERQPSWEYLLSLANLEYRLGRLAEARRHLEQLLARSPGNVRGLETLAQIELLDGDPARAAELYGDLARRTGGADALSNHGTALLLLRRPAEAAAVLRRGLALSPGNPLIELNLADALWLLGRRDEARASYRRVAQGIGDDVTVASWQLQMAKAQALAHLGASAGAVEAVQRVLRLAPDNPQAAYEASLVYTLVGDRTSALVLAEKAVRGGVNARWFGFPWFDPLRDEAAFAALMAPGRPDSPSPAAGSGPGRR